MKTKIQKDKAVSTATVKFMANALTTVLVAYSLLLKGIKLLKEEKPEPEDIILAILKDIEPHFYISCSGLLMQGMFGAEGTPIRDAADKCVVDMVKAELAIQQKGCSV